MTLANTLIYDALSASPRISREDAMAAAVEYAELSMSGTPEGQTMAPKFYEVLLGAGVPEEQARAAAEVVAEAFRKEG